MTAPLARRADELLTDADFESLDESEWQDFSDWWNRRTSAGEYHMNEFSPKAFIDRMTWLRQYALRLRARMRESRSVEHLRGLEHSVRTQAATIKRLEEAPDSMRVKALRRALEECHRVMRHWQIAIPKAGEFDGR